MWQNIPTEEMSHAEDIKTLWEILRIFAEETRRLSPETWGYIRAHLPVVTGYIAKARRSDQIDISEIRQELEREQDTQEIRREIAERKRAADRDDDYHAGRRAREERERIDYVRRLRR